MSETKYIKIFSTEIDTHISTINAAVKVLRDAPKNLEPARIIMQSLHSIKGISATMGFSCVVEVTHLLEELIESYSRKEIPLTDRPVTLIYDVLEAIEEFKNALPEELDENVERVIKKIRNGIRSGSVEVRYKSKDIDNKISNSVKEMHRSIDNNIKINVSIIDKLIDDISELKYTESALKTLNEKLKSYKLKHLIRKIEGQLRKLYNSLVSLKMQPFSTITNALEVAISKYCFSTGKKINFIVSTNNILIDSSVLKELIAPLIHLIRNAIDHGIEPVKEREDVRKAPKGNVTLTVKKIHDFAEITIEDDGRGIIAESVIKKALDNSFITYTPDEIDDNFLLYVLTRAGFTTKSEVSTVSGRGIGLDIVKSSLENIGGSITLENSEGHGLKITLKVPVTTAVIRSLLVKTGEETVAIPVSSIERIMLAEKGEFRKTDSGTYLDSPLELEPPEVISLHTLLENAQDGGDASSPTAPLARGKSPEEELCLLMIKIRNKPTAIVVDELLSEEDLFIKPLTQPLKKISSVLGYSILGDGLPVFVLDVNSL